MVSPGTAGPDCGTVISTAHEGGSAADTNWFDAFSNRQEDWESRLLAPAGGWGLHSKSRDPLAAMHYMSQRWYAPDLGVFASVAAYPPFMEHQYTMGEQSPESIVDPSGELGKGVAVLGRVAWHKVDKHILARCPFLKRNGGLGTAFRAGERGLERAPSKDGYVRSGDALVAFSREIGEDSFTPACIAIPAAAGGALGEVVDEHIVKPAKSTAGGPPQNVFENCHFASGESR